jgi:hypothetical protein
MPSTPLDLSGEQGMQCNDDNNNNNNVLSWLVAESAVLVLTAIQNVS